MSVPTAAKVFNIPELSEIILQDFTPHDFAQCILVCRAFAQVFTPILWHTISLQQDRQHFWFSTSPEVQEALRRNAHYVQVIRVRSCKSLVPFLALGKGVGVGVGVGMPKLHTLQFPVYNLSLGRYATDDLHPDPVFSDHVQQRQQRATTAATAATTVTSMATPARTPTGDWLRYSGMFLMRRRYFIDRIYRQRHLHAFHQERVTRQQFDALWNNKRNDPNHINMKIKEAEERVAQLEEEVAVQEKKFPTVAMGLGPCLVEEDLKLLKSKIRETKHEIDRLLRVRGGSATQTTTLSPPTGTGAGAWEEGEQPGFCMGYEQLDEAILEQFLARFPQLQTLMTTSIPFLNRGVIRNMVGLDNLRYLSLTIFNAISPGQVSNVHTLLNTSPPNLEILRLSFLDKDNGTADLFVTDKPRSRGSSDSTVPATATPPTAEMFSTSSSASGPTTMATNLGAKEYEGDADLDLVRLSIQRSGPLRSLRRLFIEGTLGDPALPGTSTVNQHRSPDSQTWIAFLERCPNLLTLSLGGCSAHVLPEVGQAIKLYCPRLEDLVVGYKSYLSTPSYELLDPNLAILLSSITNLKRLRIDTLSLETNSQVLSVIQHRFAGSLTELSLNDCKYHRLRYLEESHPIFNFLHSLPNLESMDLLPSGEMFHTFEHALGCSRFVSEVFSKPWTCRGALRVLRININGILRKTATYSMTREQDLKQSRLLQRRVCEFLGSFLQLEELSLGVLASAPRQKATTHWGGSGDYGIFDRNVYLPSAEDHERGPVYGAFKFAGTQHSCLALSLSCGLELMSGLKRLKIFNVARMNHLIETEEIEFMVEQWPKLEFLPGLLRWPWFQRESGEPEAEWLEQKRQVLERDESMVFWMKENVPFLRYS